MARHETGGGGAIILAFLTQERTGNFDMIVELTDEIQTELQVELYKPLCLLSDNDRK